MPRPLHDHDDDVVLEAERDIRSRLGDRALDFEAMLAVSNIYRAPTRFAIGWSRGAGPGRPPRGAASPSSSCSGSGANGRRANSPTIAGWPRGL